MDFKQKLKLEDKLLVEPYTHDFIKDGIWYENDWDRRKVTKFEEKSDRISLKEALVKIEEKYGKKETKKGSDWWII